MAKCIDTTLCDKFVGDLRQVGGFHRVLRFLHQWNWRHDIAEIVLKVALSAITPNPKTSKATAKLSEKSRNILRSNRFQWCPLSRPGLYG